MTADIRLLRWHERDREDYERLAAAIARVRAVAARTRGEMVATVPTGPEEPSDADRARALLAQRRRRDRRAGPLADMFGEPGWDLLLMLFIAYEDGEPVSAGALVAALGLRPAVIDRWLKLLADRGLLQATAADAQGASAAGRFEGAQLGLTHTGIALVLNCIGGT